MVGAGSINQPTLSFPIPLLGFCAYGSGIGKTTLLTSLIPILIARGVRVSVVKHAHHSFDIDHPGKDSYRLREAGAVQMMLGSRHRWALMTELSRIPDQTEADVHLSDLLPHIDPTLADLIVVEGFKQEPIPKIEVYRADLHNPLLADFDEHIIAIACDKKLQSELPQLNLNDHDEIADFIMRWLKQQRASHQRLSFR